MLKSIFMAMNTNGWRQLSNVYTLSGLLVLAVGQSYYELTGNGGWSYWYGMLTTIMGSLLVPAGLGSGTNLSFGAMTYRLLVPLVFISTFVLLLTSDISQRHVVDAFMSVMGLSVMPWLYLASLVYKRW